MPYTTKEDIQAAAKNIDMGGGKTATLSDAEINRFIDKTQSVINGRLSAIYYVPLTAFPDSTYPDPISYIATHHAAGAMVESVYSRIEPAISDAGKAHKDAALMELAALIQGTLNGSQRLAGQQLKSRNTFANPHIVPLEPPR